MMYPDAKITHLTHCHSNYCLVLLEVQPRTQNGRSRSFRFQTGWLLDPSFLPIVHQVWESNNRLVDAIIWFTQKAKEWNKNQFGNIFTRRKNLMSRLKLEDELLRDMDLVLRQRRSCGL